MRSLRIMGALVAALAGVGAAEMPTQQMKPHRPEPKPIEPRAAVNRPVPYRRPFGEGRSTLKRTMRPRPRPVYGEHHDPRSNGGGPKLQRKAYEGKL